MTRDARTYFNLFDLQLEMHFVRREKSIRLKRLACTQSVLFLHLLRCKRKKQHIDSRTKRNGINQSFWCVLVQILNEMCKRIPKHLINVQLFVLVCVCVCACAWTQPMVWIWNGLLSKHQLHSRVYSFYFVVFFCFYYYFFSLVLIFAVCLQCDTIFEKPL